ncbi:MAG: NAD(P)H-dependent oxidoreductase subunit E [Nitrospirae bacterium]|nr:NAD(P)H-dependent oxidoreductase subunit E [Nitrospirota bacterium]
MADDIKILVVDDEPAAIKNAERALKAMGFDVEGALGGKEAITKMEQNNYSLVLTDLKMPEMDGLTLTGWIRKSRPDTGVVIIADYPSQDTIKEALALGVIDYVPKPFTPAVLTDVTHRALKIKGKVYVEEKPREEFTPSMLNELDRAIKEYKKKPGSSIPALQRAQEIVGYLPPEIQKRIARGLNISPAEIHSIVSFYAFFTMKPRGDHLIRCCLGTACFVRGIEAILNKLKEVLKIDVGDTTEDRKFSLETVRCLGCCAIAPVMMVDEEPQGALTPKKAVSVLNKYAPVGMEEAHPEEVGIIEEKE